MSDLPAVVTFTGKTMHGKEVSLEVVLNQSPEWQTVTFPDSFKRLEEVAWRQGDCTTNMPHMFDNINVMPSSSKH